MRSFFPAVILAFLPGMLSIGCCPVVHPPDDPSHPTAIYIADYGHHSSVTFPAGQSAFVEYSFGDWNYYALNHSTPFDAFRALFFSPSSALGRRYTVLKPGQTEPAPYTPARTFPVYVSRAAADRVRDDLETRWQSAAATKVHNVYCNTDFVLDPRGYSWFNDCNAMTANILRDTGCTVSGLTFFSCFKPGCEVP